MPEREGMASYTAIALETGNVTARAPRVSGSAEELSTEKGSFQKSGNSESGQLISLKVQPLISSISRKQYFPFGLQFSHLQSREATH